jgi:hypothetical protein
MQFDGFCQFARNRRCNKKADRMTIMLRTERPDWANLRHWVIFHFEQFCLKITKVAHMFWLLFLLLRLCNSFGQKTGFGPIFGPFFYQLIRSPWLRA